MKYFKDKNNQVFAFESDGSQDVFIPEGLILITETEADEIRFPPKSAAQILQDQIADIDVELKAIDDERYRTRGGRELDLQVAIYMAGLQGITEPQLYVSSVEYKRVKDAELITAEALRNQRKVLKVQLEALT